MVFERFASRAKKYGIKRILTDADLKIAIGLAAFCFLIQLVSCNYLSWAPCVQIPNLKFVETTVRFAISLSALILTGLSVLIAFADDEFLADLRELGIYENILFVFEYTLYIAVATVVLGSVVVAYDLLFIGFYLYLFFFIYMVLALVSLIEMVVTFAGQKAEFELNNR